MCNHETMCSLHFHHNGFLAIHALGYMMYEHGVNWEGTWFS